MTSRLLATALCSVLGPLLAAQQVNSPLQPPTPTTQGPGSTESQTAPLSPQETIVVPQGTRIYLDALGAISSATLSKGARVELVIAQDVTVQGTVVIRKGTLVHAKVSRVTKASKEQHRDGKLTPRLEDLRFGSGQNIRVTSEPPVTSADAAENRKEVRKDVLKFILLSPLIVLSAPLGILETAILWSERDIPEGTDVELPRCYRIEIYTLQSATAQLTNASSRGLAENAASCDAVGNVSSGAELPDEFNFKIR
jgi:hypothetical protein